MNRKGFTNILLIIAVAILIGVGGYVILRQPPSAIEEPSPPPKPAETLENGEPTVIEFSTIENLHVPWAIDFLPDGRMIFTERSGTVSVFDGINKTVVAEIGIDEVQESGLLGIAVDPEFERNHSVYLYYTYEQEGVAWNRVSKFEFIDTLVNETVLLDNIPSARFHDGGRIKFGPDGKLYVTTGDATEPPSAQNLDSLAGKILRMNKDGSVPADNPFGNYVYSYGHRNPQGLAWHPVTGKLYSAEHGPTRNDELNVIKKGTNYGWPNVQCVGSAPEYADPIRCYDDFTLAPSGIAFLGNDLYIAGLRSSQLRRITFDNDYQTIVKEEVLYSDLGRIREVVAHDGYLYIATSNQDGRGRARQGDDKIIRIKPE